jgi:type II secretory pathway predicted ATPase ExeA
MPHHSWFSDLAFGADSAGLGAVPYRSHCDAIATARGALGSAASIALLLGPKGSGKTTAARELGDTLSGANAVAIIGGIRLNAGTLLSELLSQYGYVVELDEPEELLRTVATYAIEQLDEGGSPVVIVEDAERMYPSGLRALDALAAMRHRSKPLLRIVLTGQETLKRLIASRQLAHVAQRVDCEYTFKPMTLKESMIYLHSRLEACGVRPPDSVFPVNVCDHLHAASGGWPGKLNALAVEAIESASEFPVSLADLGEVELPELPYHEPERVPELTDPLPELAPELDLSARFPVLDDAPQEAENPQPPRLVISRNGATISTFTLDDKKVLIGRSEFADVIIADGFVSKLHAMLLLYSDALVLLDLNSANGSTVNSTIVRSTVLRTNDVIVLGSHRIKVENAPPVSEQVAKVLESGDTRKMKSLMDTRRRRLLKAKLKVIES